MFSLLILMYSTSSGAIPKVTPTIFLGPLSSPDDNVAELKSLLKMSPDLVRRKWSDSFCFLEMVVSKLNCL